MTNRYDEIMAKLQWYYLPQHIEVGENDIKLLETTIGAALPTDYRHFLSKYGVSAYKLRVAYSNGVGLEVWYGRATEGYDLHGWWEDLLDRLPAGHLAIASSPGGQICIGLEGPDRGKIFWWAEEEETPEPLAVSFDALMKGLTGTGDEEA